VNRAKRELNDKLMMWKPGTEKPKGGSKPSSSKKKKKQQNESSSSKHRPPLDLAMDDDDDHHDGKPTKSLASSSATPQKRLSGGTMNMRFMKRRKDETTPNAKTSGSENLQRNSNSKTRMDIDNDAMDVSDDHGGNSAEMDIMDGSSKYGQANSVDMYGIEASLIGRRSFKGFNEPIERIWKDSKASLEKRDVNSRKEKVSDEELLRRYQEAATKNGSDARGIGNFDKKKKRRSR
jgi:hypothetical protein